MIQKPVKYIEKEDLIVDGNGRALFYSALITHKTKKTIKEDAEQAVRELNASVIVPTIVPVVEENKKDSK